MILELQKLGLKAVPDTLRGVPNVELLSLYSNKIRQLPNWIGEMSELKAVELSDHTMEVVSGLGHAYGMAGRHSEAREVLAKMQAAAEQTYVPQVQIAFVYAGLGDTEGAFKQLQLAFEAKAWEISFMAAEPWLEHLVDDPRFKEMVHKVGFPS